MDARIMESVIGDAEARLAAVREWGQGQSAKAAALDAVVTHQADRIRELEAALDECCSTWRITQWAEHTAMYHAQRGLTAETSAQRSGDAK